jgi:hypothetical protein
MDAEESPPSSMPFRHSLLLTWVEPKAYLLSPSVKTKYM